MANRKQGLTLTAYPESLPPDWATQLEQLPFGFCYALHDCDTDENGELKKAHIHIYFLANPNKKQREYISLVTGIQFLIDVHSAGDMYEYLTHENNPEKYHYDRNIIQHSSKWSQEDFENIASVNSNNKEDVDTKLFQIVSLIDDYHLRDMGALTQYIIKNPEYSNLLGVVAKKSYYLKEYMYSMFRSEYALRNAHNAREQGSNSRKVKTPSDVLDDLNGLSRGDWVDL